MLSLRVIVPHEAAAALLHTLVDLPFVVELSHQPNGAHKPAGDVLHCVVPREAASELVEVVRQRAPGALIAISDMLSLEAPNAEAAADDAPGVGADAVIWEAVDANVARNTEISATFVLFMCIAGAIAGIGLLTDSVVLIIGAMVLGPEFGVLAAFCIASVRKQWNVALRAALLLLLGFGAAIVATYVTVRGCIALGIAPVNWNASRHPATLFVSNPDAYAVLVGCLAGIAGMVSQTTGQYGALIGVFISVTTIPAAANVAVALAYGHTHEGIGATEQLLVNIAAIVVAGIVTVFLQRWRFSQRLGALLAHLPAPRRRSGRR